MYAIVDVRRTHVTRAEAYAYAGASSIPLKYGDFIAVLAHEVSRVLRESREALTQHISITLTVKASHPPPSIAKAIEGGEGLTPVSYSVSKDEAESTLRQ